MSSGRYILVARNTVTGTLRYPLGTTTLYALGEEADSIMQHERARFGERWVLSWYAPVGHWWGGSK